jgi:hypothetical protein
MSCGLSLVVLQMLGGAAARAQEPADPPDETPREHRVARSASFVGGAAAGFLAHEGGHLLFDAAFGADPGVKRVSFAGIPFFAITHGDEVTPRQEYVISSAGFWVQHATSEWILTARPGLRRERAPLLKGWLAWNVVASVAYSTAAFGRFGPAERDTRGMAQSLGIAEPWVGGMILAPAVLDAWRYGHPDARWARWTSRAVKVGLVVATIGARAR